MPHIRIHCHSLHWILCFLLLGFLRLAFSYFVVAVAWLVGGSRNSGNLSTNKRRRFSVNSVMTDDWWWLHVLEYQQSPCSVEFLNLDQLSKEKSFYQINCKTLFFKKKKNCKTLWFFFFFRFVYPTRKEKEIGIRKIIIKVVANWQPL